MDELLAAEAHGCAVGCGHHWLGPEHYLAAIGARDSSAGAALRAGGLDQGRVRGILEGAVAAGWGRPVRKASALGDDVLVATPELNELLARAEGIAIGMDGQPSGDESVLLSLLWARRRGLAHMILEDLNVELCAVLANLRRSGVRVPNVSLPVLARWGPPQLETPESLAEMARTLQSAGRRIRFNPTVGGVRVSVENEQAED